MTFRYENQKHKQGHSYVIGCDEVGRGCLAGPVAAAAVLLPQVESAKFKVIKSCGIKDSKLLSAEKRQKFSEIIKQHALWGIGVVDEKIIDKINIHHASLLAMKLAIQNLACAYSHELAYGGSMMVAVDGKFVIPGINMEQEAIVDGDNKVLSIAAASIVAKVYRDELMRKLHQKYPIYNFAQHKGYATFHHREMIGHHGLSQIHRLSFCGRFMS